MKYYFLSFIKYDFKASITVFLVALPLSLGISLASNVPVYSGLIAGIIGGLVVSCLSGSQLSVSGPAAGLTAICAAAIYEMGSLELFFVSVCFAGLLQMLLGIFRLGGFTHFIPNAVMKGMLSAIGILLIAKQIPMLIGYNKPDFWTNELFNIITFNHAFENMGNLLNSISIGVCILVVVTAALVFIWKKTLAKKVALPLSFVTVAIGMLCSVVLNYFFPAWRPSASQYVHIPENMMQQIRFPNFQNVFSNAAIWKNAVIICFVATLETLLSIEAIDKLDPYNRVTPQNRELLAQGTGNILSGLLGGIPITAVIVRSAANAEAGAKTKLSAFTHGIWLLLTVLLAVPLVNRIPYSVLAIVLIQTGYNLTKPSMIASVYKQGREQFMPFIVTIISILFTDLLIGVLIGIGYSVYFLIKHTYRAGYTLKEETVNNQKYYRIELALNVSFLNKKRFIELLDSIPNNSSVAIIGTNSVYIDHDILEVFHDFQSKAKLKNIQLVLKDVPDVETIELHQ